MATTTGDNRELIHEWITRPLPSLLLPIYNWRAASDNDPQCLPESGEPHDAAAGDLALADS